MNLPPPKPIKPRSQRCFFRVGDVFMHAGCEYYVETVNESRVRCQPLTKIKVVRCRMVKKANKWREEITESLEYGPRNVSLSPVYWTADTQILRRMKRDEFLGKRTASPAQATTTEATTDNDEMKTNKNAKKTPPAKKPAAAKSEPRVRVYEGRSDYLRDLLKKGLDDEAILAKAKASKYWDTSMAVVVRARESYLNAQASAEKAAAKGTAVPKGKKAPPAKKAPKAKKAAAAPKAPPAKAPKAKGTPPPKPATAPSPAAEQPQEALATSGEGFDTSPAVAA